MFKFENLTQIISSFFTSVTEKFVDLVVSKTIKINENLQNEFSGLKRFLSQQLETKEIYSQSILAHKIGALYQC